MEMYNGFQMKTKPWVHQLKALKYLFERDYGALYTEPGSGKTKIMIDLIVNRGFKRVLIVAPKVACTDVWPDEIFLHSYFTWENVVPLATVCGDEKARLLKMFKKPKPDEKPTIFICNYDSVWREPARRIWLQKNLALDCVICDESHKIKSPGSKCSSFLAQLGKSVPHRYLMTGTPLAENPMDVYAQYRFLNRAIFGTNYAVFCEQYQNVDVMASSKVGYPILVKDNPYKNLDDLREKMFSCAFRMPSTVKLPDVSKSTLKVQMPEELERIYREAETEGAVEYGDGFLTVDNVLASITRKQQITSGYLALEYDDGSKSLQRVSTYRRTALLKLLRDEIPPKEPVVVFAKFRKDITSVRKVAERLGQGYSEVSGSANTLSDWKKGKTRVLCVQYGSGAEGINLIRSRICIFYSLDHSLAKYEQAIKRIHRPGQTRPCMYYHMVAVKSSGKTIDQHIMSALKNKRNIVDDVMSGRKKL